MQYKSATQQCLIHDWTYGAKKDYEIIVGAFE